jgi:formylglycine-generating enzyme required for sulfatase activity
MNPHRPTAYQNQGATHRVAGLIALTWLLALSGCATPPPPTSSTPGPQIVENLLGMKFVRVPAGEFVMGRTESTDALATDFQQYPADRLALLTDELPAHRVTLSQDFFMGQHEVTVGQFRQFVNASGYVPESVADGTGGYGYNPAYDPATSARGDAFEGRDPQYSWLNPGFKQGENEPVLNVTWHDAVALSRWLSQQEGHTYRLPTEAEWEYACRAGSDARYGSVQAPAALATTANTFDSTAARNWPHWTPFALAQSDGFAFTAPVGSFPANAFGLHDMVGNAWEWVSDSYDENYYATSPAQNPTGPEASAMRVRRGGSWHTWSLYARCSYRNINTQSSRYTLLGMRLVREVNAHDR